MAKTLLVVHNQHAEQCGSPRTITKESPDTYVGYFENRSGEQWIFLFDRKTGEATLRGGDTGWQNIYPVYDGQVKRLVLEKQEAAWLQACWKAASVPSKQSGDHQNAPPPSAS